MGLHRDFFCAHSAATIPIPCKPTAFISIPPSIPRAMPYASAETHNSEIPLDKSFNLYIPSCLDFFLVNGVQSIIFNCISFFIQPHIF